MTSQRVERTWIRTGGYGRFRGEWVKFCDPLEIEIPEHTLDRAVIVMIKLLLTIIITATKTTVSIFPLILVIYNSYKQFC